MLRSKEVHQHRRRRHLAPSRYLSRSIELRIFNHCYCSILTYTHTRSNHTITHTPAYASVGLIALYHDWVYLQHARPKLQTATDTNAITLVPPKWCQSAAVAFSSLSCVELFAEMAARQYYGEKARWNAVLTIESLKYAPVHPCSLARALSATHDPMTPWISIEQSMPTLNVMIMILIE